MALDKDKLFIIHAISREEIAEDLNQYLKGYDPNDEAEDEFKPDDPRLTDEFCAKYAAELGKIQDDTNSSDWAEELETRIISEALEFSFGIVREDD